MRRHRMNLLVRGVPYRTCVHLFLQHALLIYYHQKSEGKITLLIIQTGSDNYRSLSQTTAILYRFPMERICNQNSLAYQDTYNQCLSKYTKWYLEC